MIQTRTHRNRVSVVGGGPAGLMAAEVLLRGGVSVDLFESMPSVGRKFLVAGKGGLNLTHSEPLDRFLSRYGNSRENIEPHIRSFGPDDLRRWMNKLGFETFIGSSGRVFPLKMDHAAPVLKTWINRLKSCGLTIHLRHAWNGWAPDGQLRFQTPNRTVYTQTDAVVLALGGGSRSRLGSTGGWVPILREKGIQVADLKPSNCGFDVDWTPHFRDRFEGHPVKPVAVSFTGHDSQTTRKKGEFIITRHGVSGSLIYEFSSRIRDEIECSGKAVIHLDLAPDLSFETLIKRLSRPRGSRSIATHLEKTLGIKGVKAGLLREFLRTDMFQEPAELSSAIKNLPVPLTAARPIDEAISTAGGITFESLDQNLMLRSMPGVFCAGEMLDWDAPTGGYLLTACFATGRAAGYGVLAWLKESDSHGTVQIG